MSILAHSRPELIKKIFHPDSRQYREDGLYTVMLFSGSPQVITLDDRFFSSYGKSLFANLTTDDSTKEREIWFLLLEKAYAKMHGNFKIIEGGGIDVALEELTNGIGFTITHSKQDTKDMFNTGELWNKLVWYNQRNYLLGAASPPGSGDDKQKSSMGI